MSPIELLVSGWLYCVEERERLTVTLTLGFELLEERHGGGAKVGCRLAQQLSRPPDGGGCFGFGPIFGLGARDGYPAAGAVYGVSRWSSCAGKKVRRCT